MKNSLETPRSEEEGDISEIMEYFYGLMMEYREKLKSARSEDESNEIKGRVKKLADVVREVVEKNYAPAISFLTEIIETYEQIISAHETYIKDYEKKHPLTPEEIHPGLRNEQIEIRKREIEEYREGLVDFEKFINTLKALSQ